MLMKKFFILLIAAVSFTAAGCSSCSNDDAAWGIEYALQSDGKTDATVTLMIFNGQFTLNGDADYQLILNNAPKTLTATGALPLDEALACNDAKKLEAAEYVNGWLDEWFKVIDFTGHYDIYIKGFVKETKTQITFSIDRHFTNIPEDEAIDFE